MRLDEIAHHIDVQNPEKNSGITKAVDPAAIDRPRALKLWRWRKGIYLTKGGLINHELVRMRSQQTACAEAIAVAQVIVGTRTRAVNKKAEVSRSTEGLNIKRDQRGSAYIKQ